MALAAVSRQPYSEVSRMDDRELDTLQEILLDLNDTKGRRRGKRKGPRRS